MPVTIDGTNGINSPSVKLNGSDIRQLTHGTVQATTSGTSVDVTGIPSWAKRVTLMLNSVSTNGAANIRFQLGTSGGIETTGYNCTAGWAGASSGAAQSTVGFDSFGDSGAPCARCGNITFTLIGSNTWTMTGSYMGINGGNFLFVLSGLKGLSGVLDRIRITTTNGTDTFDAGSINILFE
jgi:hypothetical protein